MVKNTCLIYSNSQLSTCKIHFFALINKEKLFICLYRVDKLWVGPGSELSLA